jgi:dTMP kinase
LSEDQKDRGILVSVEGIGGSGKSTLAASIISWLQSRAVPVTPTREPGATPLGIELRKILLEGNFEPTAWADAFLFEADRAQTYARVIEPAIAAGHVVVSDRNLYGTIAYQAFGSGLDLEAIDVMNRSATGGLYPDVVIVVDAVPEVALARKGGGGQHDRFDELDLRFQARVREGYLFAARRDGARAHVLDGGDAPEVVLEQAKNMLRPLLSARGLLGQEP